MLTEYIAAALRHARYEILPEDGGHYGEIPELPGVWANSDTLEGCREELREVLEDWIALGLARGSAIPPIDGTVITIPARLMPPLTPVTRREFVVRLRSLGFDGPFAGGSTNSWSATAITSDLGALPSVRTPPPPAGPTQPPQH